MAFMIVESGDLNGRKIDLIGSLVIGRQAREGLTIKDAKASREHTRFELTSGGWVVMDLGSTNGTLLNGRKITREFLNTGDRVTVGQTVFRFENPAAQPMTSTRDMAGRAGAAGGTTTAPPPPALPLAASP
ncbi:MAG: FHA domain-containing protein, partial [Candidatus Brocadiae bacterium]|nr:FHA domain-containing protein [Candidatus Brocadiia bacterium]